MKCLKAIKSTKDVEIGEIIRVDDKTAHRMVGSIWTYVPKSEWKLLTRKVQDDQVSSEEKKPNKKKDKSNQKEKR